MSLDREYLDGLARLHQLGSAEERRATWRQSMATLAAEAAEQRPVPLEGLDPQAVLASTRVAIANGLVDDLDFLSPAASAAVLYELAAVLPMGEERRELGRVEALLPAMLGALLQEAGRGLHDLRIGPDAQVVQRDAHRSPRRDASGPSSRSRCTRRMNAPGRAPRRAPQSSRAAPACASGPVEPHRAA